MATWAAWHNDDHIATVLDINDACSYTAAGKPLFARLDIQTRVGMKNPEHWTDYKIVSWEDFKKMYNITIYNVLEVL